MSYYYKDIPINLVGSGNNIGICKKLVSALPAFNNFGFTVSPDTYESSYNNIDTKPSPLNYYNNGVDVSNYLIAAYVESSTNNSTTIPSWCKKIRALLVGGGGGPASNVGSQHIDAQIANVHVHESNTGYNTTYGATSKFTHHQQQYDEEQETHIHNPDYGGGGGGGGSFVYISSYDLGLTGSESVQQLQVQVGVGGSLNNSGGSTILNITTTNSSKNVKIISNGGNPGLNANSPHGDNQQFGFRSGNASHGQGLRITNNYPGSGGAGGNGGTVEIIKDATNNLTLTENKSGVKGNDGAAYSAGAGGSNGASSSTTYAPTANIKGVGGSNGTNGSNGYYRIYFLT